MSARIAIAGVSERDVDLLLLEEFQSSTSFRKLFLSHCPKLSDNVGLFTAASRSVTHSSGESDLEVDFLSADGLKTRLLIENKVSAGFQLQQAERYHLRGASYIAAGVCAAYHTVIVAPRRYFGDSDSRKGFDSRVMYEDLLDWFEGTMSLGERRHYKVHLLQSAIYRGTLGYQPEEDSLSTDFWRSYWLIARDYAPELEMTEPAGKPSGATFIGFLPPSLPKGVEIWHKFQRGYVDLQLSGMGSRLNEVHAIFGTYFNPDMQLKRAAKSAAIRLVVPVLNATNPAAKQLSEIHTCLDAAKRFLSWFLGHKQVWVTHLKKTQQGTPVEIVGSRRGLDIFSPIEPEPNK